MSVSTERIGLWLRPGDWLGCLAGLREVEFFAGLVCASMNGLTWRPSSHGESDGRGLCPSLALTSFFGARCGDFETEGAS